MILSEIILYDIKSTASQRINGYIRVQQNDEPQYFKCHPQERKPKIQVEKNIHIHESSVHNLKHYYNQ